MINLNAELYSRAEEIISERRSSAIHLADIHRAEVTLKIPEIAEINSRLSGTGLELLRAVLSGGDGMNVKIDEIQRSNLEAQKMIARYLQKHGYPADYLDEKFTCRECCDTGYNNGKRCSCFMQLVRRLAFERLNSSSQVRLCSFSDFNTDYYRACGDECYSNMCSVLEYCRAYAESFSADSKSIFMLGQTGLGKTHLSLAIAAEAIKKGYHAAYDSIINYLRRIESEHFGRSEGDTLELLLSADLLIMDDLGSEFESSFYSSAIYNIINTRLNYSRPTIISTNLSPQQMQKRYDDRIVSRLFAMYDYLKFTGSDIRQLKKMGK